MQQFNVGDRFSVEGVVTEAADDAGDYRALFDGGRSNCYAFSSVMASAKLIEPGHDIEDHTHITPCKGKNCGSTTGTDHSPECEAEHVAAITGVPVENKVLDLSKPVRVKRNNRIVKFLAQSSSGAVATEEDCGNIVVHLPEDLENIPEPKRTATRELMATMEDKGLMIRPSSQHKYLGVISHAEVTYTEGEGWTIEEIK